MKSVHLGIGVVWLAIVVAFTLRLDWAWWGMIVCAVSALWYLPFGTLLSVVQIIVLLLPPLRPSG